MTNEYEQTVEELVDIQSLAESTTGELGIVAPRSSNSHFHIKLIFPHTNDCIYYQMIGLNIALYPLISLKSERNP